MKKRGSNKELKKYSFYATIFILIFLSFKIIQPYIIVLISAFILSYLIRPLYLILNKKLNNTFSAIICIILLLSVILLPLGLIVGGVTNQAYKSLDNVDVTDFFNRVSSLTIFDKLNLDFADLAQKGTLLVVSLLTSAITYVPSIIISLIILLLGIYYMLIEWDNLSFELRHYLPFQDKAKVSKDIDFATKGIIYGTLFIAILEFVIGTIGFYFSGVNLYLLLPSLIFFFAFIPGLGPTLVWVPLAIYFYFTKNWFSMIGVIITGLILSIYIDLILRTKILGGKSEINPFIMLIGILGGISLFGVFGFIIGPLILIYTLKILREFVID